MKPMTAEERTTLNDCTDHVAAELRAGRIPSAATTAKHTPGPWTASDRFGNFGDRNRSEQDAPTGQISRFSYSVRDTEGFIVAHCTNPLVTMEAERSEANARLIAAAPELLEACKESLLRFESDGWPLNDLNTAAINQLRDAIAKTEGR